MEASQAENWPENRLGETRVSCWRVTGIWGDASCSRLPELGSCIHCPVFVQAGRALFERPMNASFALGSMRQAPTSQEDTWSLLVFRLGSEWLALETRLLQRILGPQTIHRIPARSDVFFKGLVNIEGSLRLCIALDQLLGLPSEDTFHRMAVLSPSCGGYVLPLNEIQDLHRVSSSSFKPVPDTLNRATSAFVTRSLQMENRTVGVLDAEKLLQRIHALFGGPQA